MPPPDFHICLPNGASPKPCWSTACSLAPDAHGWDSLLGFRCPSILWFWRHVTKIIVPVCLLQLRQNTLQTQLREVFILSYVFMSQSVTEWHQRRNSGRNLETGPEAKAMKEHCLLACSSVACSDFFHTLSRTTYPGMAPSTVSWVLSHQSLIKKIPPQTCLQGNVIFSFEVPSS